MIIDCSAPEGNSFAIIAATIHYLKHEQGLQQEALLKINRNLFSSISYQELLDAVITLTEGEIDFINVPHTN